MIKDTSNKLPLSLLQPLEKEIINVNLKIKDLNNENLFFFRTHILRYFIRRNPDGYDRGVIIYNNSGELLGSITITDESISLKKLIQNEIKSVQNIKLKASNPSKHAYLNEFWIESITAFRFGQIKPNTYYVYIIQVIQTFVGLLLITIVINSLNTKGLLQMVRKK